MPSRRASSITTSASGQNSTSTGKVVTVPLREFALPAPRTGSIELHSGNGRSAAEGREIHTRLQRQRVKSDPHYQPEVPVRGCFERDGYRFLVDGRMDGLFRSAPPRIEEIKTCFSLAELVSRLAVPPPQHPYSLQLLTYGYLYWREHGIIPRLSFHLVSARTGESRDLEVDLDLEVYEVWLERRLTELAAGARQAERRAARRRKISSKFVFPFATPRPGQIELIREVEEGMRERRPLLIQAPTGLGKTVGMLYPMLKEALGRGQRTVYVTPKNSQHAVAEEAVARFREGGAAVTSLTVTARNKICFQEEPYCHPDACDYARDYYAKVRAHGLSELLARKRKLTARTFRDLGYRYRVCPFELQIDSALEADLVICDYNYVFAPRSALGGRPVAGLDQSGKPNLVIDEAHNLPARAMEYYSPQLSAQELEALRDGIRSLPGGLGEAAEELLDGCLRTISSCGEGGDPQPRKIEPPVGRFQEMAAGLDSFVARYLRAVADLPRHDAFLRLASTWTAFTEALECAADPGRTEFFTTFRPHPTGGTVKITCCDASAFLHDCYGEFRQVVGFSATLKPFDFYAKLSGLDPATVRTAECRSPFPPERRKILIIPQVSTRFACRERNYARIAEAISRISAVRHGNYFAFFPSFDFLERVAALFEPPGGFTLIRQERSMGEAGVTTILEHLRCRHAPTIVFAVQGGSFSEGVDYAGEMVIGAFVVGPPLPPCDLERELMRQYYGVRYGSGSAYAYTIPAMARAVQAAGRVIRSETDRGLIVMMDGRFLEESYRRTMPADWFHTDVRELVSTGILQDVADFWAREAAGA